MSAQSHGLCATCGKSATMQCELCNGAPEYHPGDAGNTFYCNIDCQRRGKDAHKAKCGRLFRRRHILRAARTLKLAALTYREIVYDVNVTRIELLHGVLFLHNDTPVTRVTRCEFPHHLFHDNRHKEAALLACQDIPMTALLHRLAFLLCAGLSP